MELMGVIQKVKIPRYIPWASSRAGVCHPHNLHQICKSATFSVPILVSKHSSPFPLSVSLVNKAVVDYFFVELGVERHFEALRHFLLMEDGEFAQSLSDLLFEKVRLFKRCCCHLYSHSECGDICCFSVVYWIQMSSSPFQWNIISTALVLIKTSLWPAILPEFLSCLICSDTL